MMRTMHIMVLVASAILGGSTALAQVPAQPPPGEASPSAAPSAPAAPQAHSPGYSAATLYNLANAYARSGKPGFAILNYERARRGPVGAECPRHQRQSAPCSRHLRAAAAIPLPIRPSH